MQLLGLIFTSYGSVTRTPSFTNFLLGAALRRLTARFYSVRTYVSMTAIWDYAIGNTDLGNAAFLVTGSRDHAKGTAGEGMELVPIWLWMILDGEICGLHRGGIVRHCVGVLGWAFRTIGAGHLSLEPLSTVWV